jgi:hypothetical protein
MVEMQPVYRKVASWGLFIIAALVGVVLLTKFFVDKRDLSRFDANLEKIVALVNIPDDADPSTKFDMVRRFIHRHSVHKVDAEFQTMRGDRNLRAEQMIAYATGRRSEPVHLECSTRSGLTVSILRKLGYRARIVYVFDTDRPEGKPIQTHTFVDVLNPATGQWESQDPNYDFFWRSVADGSRVTLFNMIENPSKFEPCSTRRCGWNLTSDEGQSAANIKELLDIISIIDKANAQRVTRVTSRANLAKVFTFYDERGTFCQIWPKLCANVQSAAAHAE